MINDIKKIKKDLTLYLNSIEEDVYLPCNLKKAKNKIEIKKQLPENPSVALYYGKREKLKELESLVLNCRKCLLGLSRLKAVFGTGNPDSEIMFIGEGPGYEEDHRGEPFVGRAGQLLDKILLAMNLSREKVYIANIVKCHPMINPEDPEQRSNDRPPTPQEISICRGYLEEQIRIIRPKVVVTLGNVPTRFMLNETKGISQLRGKLYDVDNSLFSINFDFKVLPTYHPAALLRNPNLKKDTWQDMKILMDYLNLK